MIIVLWRYLMVAVLVPSFDILNLIFPRATISSLRVYTRCLLAEVMIDLHSTIVGHCRRNSRKVVFFIKSLPFSIWFWWNWISIHQVEYRTVRIDANTTASQVYWWWSFMVMGIMVNRVLKIIVLVIMMVIMMMMWQFIITPGHLWPPCSVECSSDRPKPFCTCTWS